MKIYFDESNTSGRKFENDKDKLIGASYVFHNDSLFEKISFIYDKDKYELKGSELMTKKWNPFLKLLLEKVLIWENGFYGGTFIFSARVELMLSKTYDLFYPNNLPEGELMEEIEAIRIRFAMENLNYEWAFLKSDYNPEEWRKYQSQILVEMKKWSIDSHRFIKRWFDSQSDTSIVSESENNHKQVILKTFINAIHASVSMGINECEFVIDNFTDKRTKEGIEETLGYLRALFTDITIGEIEYADSKSMIGLQVADWVASISRKVAQDTAVKVSKNPTEKDIEYLNFAKSILEWGFNEFLESNYSVDLQLYGMIHAIAFAYNKITLSSIPFLKEKAKQYKKQFLDNSPIKEFNERRSKIL